jgi:hypothetical protein
MDESKKEKLVWFCEDCGLRVILKGGKRYKEYPKIDLSKCSNSWAELIEERRLLNTRVRGCKHEHKLWSTDFCKRCGKRISNKTSLKHRMGPVCRCKVRERVRRWELEREIKELIK